jgi:hypothetical protein
MGHILYNQEKWLEMTSLCVSYLGVVRFQVLTTASMKMTALWDIASCRLVEADRRQDAPLKRRSASTRLHGAISHKAVIFIFRC